MLCVLFDRPRLGAQAEGRLLSGFDQEMLEQKCRRAGLLPDQYSIRAISESIKEQPFSVIVPLDSEALNFVCGKSSIWKWHLSPLDCLPSFKCRRAVPSFHPDQIKKEWHLNLYLEMALKRAALHRSPEPWPRKAARYLLDPCFDETVSVFERLIREEPEWLSIDIETGRSQINTFGVAWSPEDAIAVKVLPDSLPPAAFHKIFSLIDRLCRCGSKKIMQNGIYERMYLSRYGIPIENFAHDTMCAQKFLWPELEKGLDNVGRIYTMEPYWKDDGRIESEEGKQKDWGDIRDWPRHFDYNCKDSANTLIACRSQRADLSHRELLGLYDTYIRKLFDATAEMCFRGLPLNPEKQAALITEYEARSTSLVGALSRPINPRSSKEKLGLLREKGYKLVAKRRPNGSVSDSADELALKRLRLSHPDDADIKALLTISGIEKALSSYLRVRTLSDRRIRFMLDPVGTETCRFSCGKDPWGGLNAQTLTDYAKRMIEWPPDSDRTFVEIDLEQAETRYVAMDAVEENLLKMLETGQDVHRYVASEIYQKPMADVTPVERQLGKKSGHGANYGEGVTTLMDTCLREDDLVLSRKMATRMLDTYHRLFPRIRRWHRDIQSTVYRERRLVNPAGFVRYFYGRTDNATYREAYAWKPQSTIPWIVNCLLLKLLDERTEGRIDFWSHLQTHDSVLFSATRAETAKIAVFAKELDRWHPQITLPAGRLRIPVSIKTGRCLGQMEKYGP